MSDKNKKKPIKKSDKKIKKDKRKKHEKKMAKAIVDNIRKVDVMEYCFRGFLEDNMDIRAITLELKEKTYKKVKELIEEEEWILFREIYRHTGIYFRYTERHQYYSIEKDERSGRYLLPQSYSTPDYDIKKTASMVRERYIKAFPYMSIDLILNQMGLSPLIYQIHEYATTEEWDRKREKYQNWLNEQRARKTAVRQESLQDICYSYLYTALENSLLYMKGNPKVFAKKDEKGNILVSEDGIPMREVIRTCIDPNLVFQAFADAAKPPPNNQIVINQQQGLQSNQQLALPQSLEEVNEQIQDLVKTIEHTTKIKETKDVITIDQIKREDKTSERSFRTKTTPKRSTNNGKMRSTRNEDPETNGQNRESGDDKQTPDGDK